jgi:hypothetical protein
MSAPLVGGLQPRTSYTDQEVEHEMGNLIRMSSAARSIDALARAILEAKREAVRNRGPEENSFAWRGWDGIIKALEALASLTDELKPLKNEGAP